MKEQIVRLLLWNWNYNCEDGVDLSFVFRISNAGKSENEEEIGLKLAKEIEKHIKGKK